MKHRKEAAQAAPTTRQAVIAMLERSHIPVTSMTVAYWLARAQAHQ